MEEAPSRKELWTKRIRVYHEKQSLLLQHCAVHTLNNVLQAPAYTAKHFEDLAVALQHGQFPAATRKPEDSAAALPCRATVPEQYSSSHCIRARGMPKKVNEAAQQRTELPKAGGMTRGKAGEEAERCQNEGVVDAQRTQTCGSHPCRYNASENKVHLHIPADVYGQPCACTQQTKSEGDTAVPLAASHPVGPLRHSRTGEAPTSDCLTAQIHANVGGGGRIQLIDYNSSETYLSFYLTQPSSPHTAVGANCNCFSRANPLEDVGSSAAYEFQSCSESASPPIVPSAGSSDLLWVSECPSSVGPDGSIQRARTPSSIGLCERKAPKLVSSESNPGNCGEERGRGVGEGETRAADKTPTSAVDKDGHAFRKTENSPTSDKRDRFACEEASSSFVSDEPGCGACYGECRATRADANRDCSLAAACPSRLQGLASSSRASTTFPAFQACVSNCLPQAGNAPACAANMTQPLKSLSGFSATALSQGSTESLLHSSPTPFLKSELEISWRKRISSVLLGTDYSAPLGIGNYDLSLLQQLLCLHRLSLHFANNPSRLQAVVDEVQKRRIYSSLKEQEEKSGRGDSSTGKTASFIRQQTAVSDQEEQGPIFRKQEARHIRTQSEEEITVPAKSSQQAKPRGDCSGWVTIEQLRNPRLLAFILNVRVSRIGWRRLFPMVGADRHFYTIRKIRCAAATSGKVALRERTNHVVSATLLEEKRRLTTACAERDDGGRGYNSFCIQADGGESNMEISESDQSRCRRSRANIRFATLPACDTGVSDARFMKDDNCSRVHTLDHNRQQKTPYRHMDKYGVDFVWVDLDSNLSAPRIFENEDALVVHLNRKLKEALLERTRREQGTQMGRSLPVEHSAKGGRSYICVADSGGEKYTKSNTSVQEVASAVAAHTDRRNGAVGRCPVNASNAGGHPCINGDVRKPLCSGCVCERALLDAQEAWHCTCSRHEGESKELSQYSSTVDPRAGTAEPKCRDSFRAWERVSPVSMQGELTAYSLRKRVQQREGDIATTKQITAQYIREAKAADKVCRAADWERGKNTPDGTGTLGSSDGSLYRSEEGEHRRGYKDLILIEVLEEEGAGALLKYSVPKVVCEERERLQSTA